MDKDMSIMHIVNCIGNSLNQVTANAILQNIKHQNIIDLDVLKLIDAALSDRTYLCVPVEFRDSLRASILKNMLLTQI